MATNRGTRGDKHNRPELEPWKPRAAALTPIESRLHVAAESAPPGAPLVKRTNFTTSLLITEALRMYTASGKVKDAATHLARCGVPLETSVSVLNRPRWRKNDTP